MSPPNLEPLRKSLRERIRQLEEKHNQAIEYYRGDGSDKATWSKLKPEFRQEVVVSCLSDLDGLDDLDDLLRVLAEWRRDLEESWAFKMNNPPNENQRNSVKKAEIRGWIDQLVDLIPDSEFSTCGICGSPKMPESDRRRKIGYRWECPECY